MNGEPTPDKINAVIEVLRDRFGDQSETVWPEDFTDISQEEGLKDFETWLESDDASAYERFRARVRKMKHDIDNQGWRFRYFKTWSKLSEQTIKEIDDTPPDRMSALRVKVIRELLASR